MAVARSVAGPRPSHPLDPRVLAFVVARLVATLSVAEALAADRRDLEAGRFYALTVSGKLALEQAKARA